MKKSGAVAGNISAKICVYFPFRSTGVGLFLCKCVGMRASRRITQNTLID